MPERKQSVTIEASSHFSSRVGPPKVGPKESLLPFRLGLKHNEAKDDAYLSLRVKMYPGLVNAAQILLTPAAERGPSNTKKRYIKLTPHLCGVGTMRDLPEEPTGF